MKSAVVCCSVLQCAAVNCSLLQCAAVRCSVLQCAAVCCSALQRVAVRCSVLQCVAVYCSALQYVAVCSSMLQRATSVLQYVAVTICSHATHSAQHWTHTQQTQCTTLDAHMWTEGCAQHWTHTCKELFVWVCTHEQNLFLFTYVHKIGRTRVMNCLFLVCTHEQTLFLFTCVRMCTHYWM
jgi:hypothetical protein